MSDKITATIKKYQLNEKYKVTPWPQIAKELSAAGVPEGDLFKVMSENFPGIDFKFSYFEDYAAFYHAAGMPQTEAVHLAAQKFPALFENWKSRLTKGDRHLKELFPR